MAVAEQTRVDVRAVAPTRPRPAATLPGLAVAAVAALLGYAVNRLASPVSPMIVAILLGIAVRSLGGYRDWMRPGLTFAAKGLLRAGIVLLGLQLVAADILALGFGPLSVVVASVAAAWLVTRWVGRRLGLRPATALLVATGVSICGASAVIGMNEVADGEEEDVVTAIGVVTVLGTLCLLLIPGLGLLLGLDDTLIGLWAGASIHEVGQVVAVGGAVGAAALATAVVVKLCRVALLAPLVALVATVRRHTAAIPDPADADPTAAGRRGRGRPPVLPWFVTGFLAAMALRSTGVLPPALVTVVSAVAGMLLAAAMFAVGTSVDLRTVARGGGRALATGAAGTLVLAGTSLAGLLLVGAGS
ncbi:putative sulfate exporter family transporter [Plantactinospora sp. B5E13]|uniref:YeiH family protein n=1 Tax=unclassified Plantactinospora TaxID=2631981 RepID=UPI00325F7583